MIVAAALFIPSVATAEPTADVARVLEGLQLRQTLTVDNTGAEPRQTLRWRPEPGATAAYQLSNTQAMNMSMIGPDGKPIDLSAMANMAPTITMNMTHTVADALPNGMVPVIVAYESPSVSGVPPKAQAAMQQGMSMLDDIDFRMLVAADGSSIEQIDVTAADPTVFELTQSMVDQFLTQMPNFPDEPVGVGATWTLDVDMSVAGMELNTAQKVVVTELSEDTVTMDVTFVMSRGDGPMNVPGMPPEAQLDISRFDGTGSGTMRTDLTSLVSTGSIIAEFGIGMTVSGTGGPPMSMDMSGTQTTEMRLVR